MAGRNFDLSIIINAIDKTANAFADVQKSTQLTDGQLLALGATATATLGAMVLGIKKVTDVLAIQEEAELKLAQAMITSGIYTAENFQSNLNLASSLQKVSRFGDETILMAQSKIAMFVKDHDMTQALIKASLDLAEAKGMDLVTASDLVARSIGTETNALSRYGITMDSSMSQTEKAESVLQSISNLFGGQATAATLTYRGQQEQLKNAFGDLLEIIGKQFMPLALTVVQTTMKLVYSAQDWVQENQALIKVVMGVVGAIAGIVAVLTSTALIIPKVLAGFKLLTVAMNANPYIALGAILLTLILNWNNIRNAMDENSKVGKIVIAIMDGMRASLTAIIEVVKIAASGFVAMAQAMRGNFKDAINTVQNMKDEMMDLPKKVAEAYNKIDTTAKESNKNRASYEEHRQSQIAIMQEQEVMRQAETNAMLTEMDIVHKEEQAMREEESILSRREQRELELQENLDQQQNIKTGFIMAHEEMMAYKINWYNKFSALSDKMRATFVSNFENMILKGGNLWKNFSNLVSSIGDVIKTAMVNMIAEVAANWVMKHLVMNAATLAWKGVQLMATAAVSAASAIASAFRSIPFPANIAAAAGAGVLAYGMVKKFFASGVRGFGGGMAVVGENGPELVNLPNGSDVFTNAESRNLLNKAQGVAGGGKIINVNIDFGGSTFMGTVDDITEALSDSIFDKLRLQQVL